MEVSCLEDLWQSLAVVCINHESVSWGQAIWNLFSKVTPVAAGNNSSHRRRFPSLDRPHPSLLLPPGILLGKMLEKVKGAWQLQGITDRPVQASSLQLQFNMKSLPLNSIDPRWNTCSFPGGFHFRNWGSLNSCCFIWLLSLCFSWERRF